jgi:hypothetical protein
LGGLNKGGLSSIIGFLIGVGYFIFFWVSQNGQTLGKRAMAIRIVKENGQPIDLAAAILRYIGYIISSVALFLGFIWVAFDSKKQGWHDKIANTYVVKTEGKPKTWLAVLLFSIYLIILVTMAVIFSLGLANGLKGGKNLQQKQLQQLNQFAPELTKEYINQTLNKTHAAVDTYRVGKNLSKIEIDNHLCAYAQRRLSQLDQLKDSEYDSARGFYEDLANPNMSQAYFSEYLNAGEMFYPMNSSIKPDDIINSWIQGEGSNLNKPEYSKGCVQADTKSLIFILVTPKKK